MRRAGKDFTVCKEDDRNKDGEMTGPGAVEKFMQILSQKTDGKP
jgi:hypothetical protein